MCLIILFGICRFEILFGVCRLENGFVALAYLVALKMIFCQLSIWKCFLALVPLNILCRWLIREWFFFDACRCGNILLVLVVLKIFLAFVAMKMIFWLQSLRRFFGASSFENSFLVDVTVNFFTFASFKMIFWCSFLWKVFGACCFNTFFCRFD